MNIFTNIYIGKKVLVTGHTGFKGAWLSLWLKQLGAHVSGLSIDVPSDPSHFDVARLSDQVDDYRLDICDGEEVKKLIYKVQPDFVFHLAAQALVRPSYENPIGTIATNALGSANVLDALRQLDKHVVAVMITSDKAYDNVEWVWGYRETDRLGGKDPYSASKAAAELAIQSYIHSFFPIKKTKVLIGVARAGNVIGGGDWSANRLIPDCVRSWSKNKKVKIRNPKSTRPWQHVLEALSGYLFLAINLEKNSKLHGEVFNFGPNNTKNYNVIFLVKLMKEKWKKISWKLVKKNKKNFYESNLLKLNSNKAKKILKWKSILTFAETIDMVTVWYKNYYFNSKNIYTTSFNQIKSYEKFMKKRLIR